MPDPTPKRRGPAPKGAVAMTSAERMRASRQARRATAVDLDADTLAVIDAVARRDGDASRPACIARLAREAVTSPAPSHTPRPAPS